MPDTEPNPAIAFDQNEPLEETLTFREQADGRKVARLPGGKVVLIHLQYMDTVQSGERWRVRLSHRDTFAIAYPLERIFEPDTPLLSPQLAEQLRAKLAVREAESDKSDTVLAAAPAPAEDATPAAHVAPGPTVRSVRPQAIVQAGDRVALFVDGANMDGAAREAGYFVDYGKAREFFLSHGTFYAAFYYIADFTAKDPLQQRFLDYLSHAGFIVRRKPVKVIHDKETGERIIKGNLDTEIVLDMINTADNYDLAFLFSGDSDFERAVELLRSRGKRVYVVTSQASLSRELAYVADKPIFLIEDFREALDRKGR
jgi:uncharacterized LabA/DUF88 family protein